MTIRTYARKMFKKEQRAMPVSGQKAMLILAAIFNQDRTANEIIEAVWRDAKVKLPVGGIYTQLERLEKSGLVKGYYGSEKPKSRGGRRRRYYEIKAAGKRALTQIEAVRGRGVVR